jgi:hypothetical protein
MSNEFCRKRFTEPIDVRLYQAREHLANSRRLIDQGEPQTALWSIMQAVINLQRVKRRLDG